MKTNSGLLNKLDQETVNYIQQLKCIFTCAQVQDMSNQVGNYFADKGFAKGDVVALFMENRPEYVIVWMGLNKVRQRTTQNINDEFRVLMCVNVCRLEFVLL